MTDNFELLLPENSEPESLSSDFIAGSRIPKSRILSKSETDAIKNEEIKLRKTAGFWASKLVNEYKKGDEDKIDRKAVAIKKREIMRQAEIDEIEDDDIPMEKVVEAVRKPKQQKMQLS